MHSGVEEEKASRVQPKEMEVLSKLAGANVYMLLSTIHLQFLEEKENTFLVYLKLLFGLNLNQILTFLLYPPPAKLILLPSLPSQ